MVTQEHLNSLFTKPNIEPLDENTQRIRRNLLAVSVIIFFISYGSSGVDPESTFLGIKFRNVDLRAISYFALLSVTYFLIHFCWAIKDHFTENNLRLTAFKVAKNSSNGFGSPTEFVSDTEELSQSTIYGWLSRQITHYNQYAEAKKRNHQDQVQSETQITQGIERIEKQLSIVHEALQRFDNGFWQYQRSQLFRWYILDMGIPVFLGSVSVGTMLAKVYLS